MSSDASSDNAQSIELFQSTFVANLCGISTVTLLWYEYAITLRREVYLFWSHRFTGATILFLLNRYLSLINISIEAISLGHISDKGCPVYVNTSQGIGLLPYITWGAFSALRVFALTQRRWPLALIVLLLSLVPVGLNYSQYHWLRAVNDPILGCQGSLESLPAALAKKLIILSRGSLILSDAIVLGVTWYSTYITVNIQRELNTTCSFAAILLRDGTVYFLYGSSTLIGRVRTLIGRIQHSTPFERASSVVHLALSGYCVHTNFGSPERTNTLRRPPENLKDSGGRLFYQLHDAVHRTSLVTSGESTDSDSVAQSGTLSFARETGSLGSSIILPTDIASHTYADVDSMHEMDILPTLTPYDDRACGDGSMREIVVE
ncbi:hypothetical protein C8Q74DRAFT_1442074 [Fomes fomentarius]|nr:hypothetical protein C8Q74DRAFT_1442074 [Fomes fomentarius]